MDEACRNILLWIIFVGLSAGHLYSVFSYKYNKENLNDLKLKKYHMSKNHIRAYTDIYDTEEQYNTRKWEFERITSEIEELESLTKIYFYVIIGCIIAQIVYVILFVFGCGPFLRFFSSLFHNPVQDNPNHRAPEGLPSDAGPLPVQDNQNPRAPEVLPSDTGPLPVQDNQNPRAPEVLPSDTGPLPVRYRRNIGENGEGSVVIETAADPAGVPPISNDSER